MNLAKDIFRFFSKDEDFHTLGELIAEVGNTIPAEIATQIHAKDNVGAKMPLDEKIRSGRRRKVLNTLTSLCKKNKKTGKVGSIEEDLSPAALEAAKDTSLARRFRMEPSRRQELLKKFSRKDSGEEAPKEKTPKRRPLEPRPAKSFPQTDALGLLEQLKAFYRSRFHGVDLEDALRHIRELSRIKTRDSIEIEPAKIESPEPDSMPRPPDLVRLDEIQKTVEAKADADVPEELRLIESEQEHVSS